MANRNPVAPEPIKVAPAPVEVPTSAGTKGTQDQPRCEVDLYFYGMDPSPTESFSPFDAAPTTDPDDNLSVVSSQLSPGPPTWSSQYG